MSTDKSFHKLTHQGVLKSAGVIALATFCSRVLGFIRDIVIARLFGVYLYAQAFVIAFRIPNLFRDFLGEGAANAAFVPIFSEYLLKHEKKEFWHLANVMLNFLLVILMGLTVLGIVFAPLLVRLIAPGFILDPQKLAATVLLTRIIFPYILLISLAVYCTAILNSLRNFSIPAFAPCLLNIAIIACALFFGEGIKGLASGVLIGGVLQLLVQIPVLYKKGFRMHKFLRDFKHPAAKHIGKLMVPRLFSSGIYQLNNLVDSIFGSLVFIVGEGAVAGLYFAYRLIQFPIGIFSNALSQAILPTFSTLALSESKDELRHSLSFGLRLTFFVMFPASVGFMVMSQPLILALFGGGKFDIYSVLLTSKILFYYSIGLVAYGSIKIMQSCFFALKDTKTPAKISFLALIVSITLNSILMFPMKVSGIALASSLSGISASLFLFFILKKKLAPFDVKPIAFSFFKIMAASILMGLVCFIFLRFSDILVGGQVGRVMNLLLIVLCAVASYVIFCFIFRVDELRQALNLLSKKKMIPPPPSF